MYTSAGLSDAPAQLQPDPHSEAGAAWLRSRRLLALGGIEFDGLILPLLSPNARFIATQVGPTPEWGTVLAERDAPLPPGTIHVLRIDPEATPPLSTQLTLPHGVLLGRAATLQGFLVELPSSQGASRRIGIAHWHTGGIEWLTDETADSAFGAFGPRGELAFSRREPGSAHWSLVLRDADGLERAAARPGASLVFPQIAASEHGLVVFAVMVSEAPGAPLELGAFVQAAPADRSAASLTLVGSVPLSRTSTLYEAFQCVAASQSAPDLHASDGLVVFSSANDAVAIVSLGVGKPPRLTIRPLVPGTFAAIQTSQGPRPGILACTSADTFYQDLGPTPAPGGQSSFTPALVWPKPGVIRRTNRKEWPYLALFMETSSPRSRLEAVLVGCEATESGPVDGF